MKPEEYFNSRQTVAQKRYEALRDFFVNNRTADEVAKTHGFTLLSFYALVRDFRNHLKKKDREDFFFKTPMKGRKKRNDDEMNEIIVSSRKKNYSTLDILSLLHSKGYDVSYQSVYKRLKEEGFARLPRRTTAAKKQLQLPPVKAPIATTLELKAEKFQSTNTGLLAFLPIIHKYGIHSIIEKSMYPSSREISNLSAILSFLALKLSNIKRYSHDDLWCMDRGMGLFAGLNVLPKSAWFSSYFVLRTKYKYSSGITAKMNLEFLKELHQLWCKLGLLSDTVNLDFTTIPYWGDGTHLENNWSGKRGKALPSMLAILAQDPDNGIIDYANCDVMHKNETSVVLEFIDFYHSNDVVQNNSKKPLKYLIFDSKFTSYQNLAKLDDQQIKFTSYFV